MKKKDLKTKMTSLVLAIVMMVVLLPVMTLNASAATLPLWPVQGYKVLDEWDNYFGWRVNPYSGEWSFHYGVDIAAPTGTAIYAIADGEVTFAGNDGGYGLSVKLRSDTSYFKGYSRYSHCSKLNVSYGQKVRRGDIIAYVGSTGNSTGPHLHFGTWDLYNYDNDYNPLGFAYGYDYGPSGYDPQGCLDSVTGGKGTVTVRGWAFDRDALSKALAIHVYIGGAAGSANAEGYAITANKSRADVNRAYPGVGDYHGFDGTISTKKTGTQDVYVYAINVGGTPGNNVLLGKKTITITSDAPPTKQGVIINVNSYYNPGTDVTIRYWAGFSIPANATVTILDSAVDPADGVRAYKVNYNGNIGWVSERYIRLL